MDNEVEEDRERDGPTSSSTTWRTCGSRWRTQGIVPNGREPVWLTPHQRDSQPEGERDSNAFKTLEEMFASIHFFTGGATVVKVGSGYNFARGESEKIFLGPTIKTCRCSQSSRPTIISPKKFCGPTCGAQELGGPGSLNPRLLRHC